MLAVLPPDRGLTRAGREGGDRKAKDCGSRLEFGRPAWQQRGSDCHCEDKAAAENTNGEHKKIDCPDQTEQPLPLTNGLGVLARERCFPRNDLVRAGDMAKARRQRWVSS